MNIQIKKFCKDDIVVLCIGVLTLIPNTTSGLEIRVVLLLLALILLILNHKMRTFNNTILRLLAMMILSAGISCCVGLLYYNDPNLSLILHEAARMLVNIMILIVVYRASCSFASVYRICAFIFCIVFAIQLLQWWFPYQTNDFIRWLYVSPGQEAKHLVLATIRKRGVNGFRAGSIYINPNICAQVIVCCITAFLLEFRKHKSVKAFLGIIAGIISIFLCGSRTGFMICIIIIGISLVDSKTYKALKNIIVCGSPVVLLGTILVISRNIFSTMRIFQVSNALTQSLLVKINIFVEYIKNASLIEILFGSLGNPVYYQIDAEWGYIITYYGVLGLIWYLQFIVVILQRRRKNDNISWIFPLFITLCGITCTVFFNLQVSSLFILLALSNYKLDEQKNNRIEHV